MKSMYGLIVVLSIGLTQQSHASLIERPRKITTDKHSIRQGREIIEKALRYPSSLAHMISEYAAEHYIPRFMLADLHTNRWACPVPGQYLHYSLAPGNYDYATISLAREDRIDYSLVSDDSSVDCMYDLDSELPGFTEERRQPHAPLPVLNNNRRPHPSNVTSNIIPMPLPYRPNKRKHSTITPLSINV